MKIAEKVSSMGCASRGKKTARRTAQLGTRHDQSVRRRGEKVYNATEEKKPWSKWTIKQANEIARTWCAIKRANDATERARGTPTDLSLIFEKEQPWESKA